MRWPSREEATSWIGRYSRCFIISALMLVVVITVGSVIGTYKEDIISFMSQLEVDAQDPGTATLFILAGLGLFVFQFIGLSWWLFPTSFFYKYLAFLFCFIVCLVGISANFTAGRTLRRCLPRSSNKAENSRFADSVDHIEKLQQHFESQPLKFVTLLCFSPAPLGLCISLLGLYTDIRYWHVLVAATGTMMVQSMPIVLITSSAASLVEAFDDPINIISTVMTILAAVLMCIGLSVYTKRELAKIESPQKDQESVSKGGDELGSYAQVELNTPDPNVNFSEVDGLAPVALEFSPEPNLNSNSEVTPIVREKNIYSEEYADDSTRVE